MSGPNPSKTMDALQWLSENLKPTCGVKSATAVCRPKNVYKDVTGTTLEITPGVASTLLCTATFEFITLSKLSLSGTLSLDGVDQTPAAILDSNDLTELGEGLHATVTQSYALALAAAEKHTIKMRVKSDQGVEGGFGSEEAGTRFIYLLVAS